MKKICAFSILFMALTLYTYAQSEVMSVVDNGKDVSLINVAPSTTVKDGKAKLIVMEELGDSTFNVKIYGDGMKVIKTFDIVMPIRNKSYQEISTDGINWSIDPSSCSIKYDYEDIAYADYDNKDILTDGLQVIFTQNFFNDDDNWEYVVPGNNISTSTSNPSLINGVYRRSTYSSSKITKLEVKNDLGDVLYTFNTQHNGYLDFIQAFRICGASFVIIYECASNTEYYTLYEINHSTGVKAISTQAKKKSSSQFNVNGLQVSNSFKGLIISNGQKYINK